MQREEKQLDSFLEAILNRLNDIKNSILTMIQKIETEYETIHWPTFLDNFALISSHVSYNPVYVWSLLMNLFSIICSLLD